MLRFPSSVHLVSSTNLSPGEFAGLSLHAKTLPRVVRGGRKALGTTAILSSTPVHSMKAWCASSGNTRRNSTLCCGYAAALDVDLYRPHGRCDSSQLWPFIAPRSLGMKPDPFAAVPFELCWIPSWEPKGTPPMPRFLKKIRPY